MKRLVLTLTVLGLISALVLAFVFQWTKPFIAEHAAQKKKEAILAVLPQSDDYTEVSKNGVTFFEGNKAGEVAVSLTGGGFQGEIELMLGANPAQGIIYGIRILEHSETPGLGANIEGEGFLKNFIDKPFGDYQVVKRPVEKANEVEAISGATISSDKVTTIVEQAVQELQQAYGGGM